MCTACHTEEERIARWEAIRADPTIMTDEDIKALLEYLKNTYCNNVADRTVDW